MEITLDRIKHSLAVARKMKKIVEENPDKFTASPNDVFVIGILHDIGYEFAENQQDHASKGGMVLKNQGYKYWREIFFHGFPQEEYSSPELWLLNFADMVTSPAGEYVTISQRIDDIAKRYGENSVQKQEALSLSNLLASHGYCD